MPHEKSKMIDITRDKPIKVSVRVAVPVRDHPKVIYISNSNERPNFSIKFSMFPVQFCWKAVGTERKFIKTTTRGDNV